MQVRTPALAPPILTVTVQRDGVPCTSGVGLMNRAIPVTVVNVTLDKLRRLSETTGGQTFRH